VRALTMTALGAALAAAFTLAPTALASDDALVLTRGDVPGWKSAGAGAAQARAALGRRVPALSRARTQGAAYRSGTRRLSAGAFVLASAKRAASALRAAGHGGRRVRGIGDGAVIRALVTKRATDVVIVARAGPAIGAVRVRVKSRWAAARAAATAYAQALVGRLRRNANATAWERTLRAIHADGSITPATALRAFAIAYGPLPGVKRPAGANLGVPQSATLAMQLVARVWSKLTPGQQAAIDQKLGAPHGPDAAAAERRGARAAAQALTPDPAFQAKADGYASFYRSKIPGVPALTIRAFKASEDITTGSGGKAWADALPVNAAGEWGSGAPAYCRVRVPPYGQAQVGKPFFELIMAHEVFHCVQFALMTNWRQRSAWIIEGMADWAATNAYLTSQSVGAGPFRLYLSTPGASLLARSYDGSGFWGHADETFGAGSLWAKVPAILGAPDDATSFALAGGTADQFISTWASAQLRYDGAGAPWRQQDPYLVPTSIIPPQLSPVTSSTSLASPGYTVANSLVVGDPASPLVNVLGLRGKLRAGTSSVDFGTIENDWFCLGSKCTCPKGTSGNVPANHKVPNGLLTLALTGGAGDGGGRVTYHSLDEFCQPKKKQTPGRPNSGGGPAGPAETNGDPHLTSLDGLHFDFQAAGEFLLTRSKSGDLEVQARQQTWHGSTTVTVNTQIGMRAGTHRVTVSPGTGGDDPLPVVRVDGTPNDLPVNTTMALGDARLARKWSGAVSLTWPDGSSVEVRGVGPWGVAASIELAAARRRQVSGLLGTFDGNPSNDLATRSGKVISYTAVASDGWSGLGRFDVKQEFTRAFTDALYDTVGDSWRISQKESILDYGPGQSTNTFTDRSIPRRAVDPTDFSRAARARAEQICRAHGVTQPGPLADCITDLLVTGNPAFADDAAAAQEAANVSWTKLAAGADRRALLSLLETPDGSLHLAWNDRPQNGSAQMLSVALDPLGFEGPAQTIDAIDGDPWLLSAPDGSVRAVAEQIPSDRPSGIYHYARAADGSWSRLGPVTTVGYSYASRPDALFSAGGALLTVSPMAGNSRVFAGAADGNPGIDPNPAEPDCYTTSPALARDGASGAVWLAWVQWDCPDIGVYVQQLDPATGTPVGAPVKAPGSSWTRPDGSARYPDLTLSERLAFTGRPGQAGVFLAYPTDDGANVRLWRVGDPGAATIPKRKDAIGLAYVSAEPSGGRLWIGWEEDKRLWVQRTSAAGTPEGSPRPIDPPRGSNAPLLAYHTWDIAARAGALDVIYGFRRDGDTPGGLWHATVVPGPGGALTAGR